MKVSELYERLDNQDGQIKTMSELMNELQKTIDRQSKVITDLSSSKPKEPEQKEPEQKEPEIDEDLEKQIEDLLD